MNPTGLQAAQAAHLEGIIAPAGMGACAGAFGAEGRSVRRRRVENGVRQLKDGRWQWFYRFSGRLHRHLATSRENAERALSEVLSEVSAGRHEAPAAPRGLKRVPDGRWQYSWTFKGRYHRVLAPTRAIAAASLAKIQAQIAEGRYLEKEAAHETRFEDAVKKFLEWGETNLADGTQRRDKEFSALWLASPSFKGRTLADITTADVEAYRTTRLGSKKTRTKGKCTFETRPAGKVTCDNDLSRLRRLFSLCIGWKLTKENPAKGVKFFRPESRHDRFLTHEEEKAILQACPADVRPAVVFALNTGIRQGELLSLTWGQVDLVRKVVTLTADKTKGKKTRRVPLNQLAVEVLKGLPRGIVASAPVFPIIAGRDQRDLVRRFEWAVDKTKINKDVPRPQRVTWHTLRHTFASRLVQSGVSLLAVKELLGHSTLAMVMRYAHLADENLKAAVDTLALVSNMQTTCNQPQGGESGGGA
jgi:integrase